MPPVPRTLPGPWSAPPAGPLARSRSRPRCRRLPRWFRPGSCPRRRFCRMRGPGRATLVKVAVVGGGVHDIAHRVHRGCLPEVRLLGGVHHGDAVAGEVVLAQVAGGAVGQQRALPFGRRPCRGPTCPRTFAAAMASFIHHRKKSGRNPRSTATAAEDPVKVPSLDQQFLALMVSHLPSSATAGLVAGVQQVHKRVIQDAPHKGRLPAAGGPLVQRVGGASGTKSLDDVFHGQGW